MNYDNYLEQEELKEYRKHTEANVNDMNLDCIIGDDICTISNEVGGQEGMYANFPISRVYRNAESIRVYCLTSVGGIAIIQTDGHPQIVTLGEDDGNFFLNSAGLYCKFYGNKTTFVWALSEALSLFNNIN